MRIAVSDLVGKPGATRRLARTIDRVDVASEWGPLGEALAGPIDLDLHLDSVVEGILARGHVRATLSQPCGRCLEPVRTAVDAVVAELFRPEGHEDAEEGYEVVEEAIDLELLARDAVGVELPTRPLCRDDCRGLCPTCGANLNETECGHGDEPVVDERWAKLAELRLPDET